MSGSALSPLHRMAANESRWRGYVDAMRAGKTEPLAQLYDETSAVIFGLALRMLDREDAEEIVLDVYQQLWGSRHTFDTADSSVWGWLVSATRSRALERSHSAASSRRRDIHMQTKISPSGPKSIFQEERTLVLSALDALLPEQRQAIELAFFGGLNPTEVAQVLAVPLGTIKNRIHLGMRRLREAIAPRGSIENAN